MKYSDPNQIISAYQNKKLDKASAINELIAIIENSDDKTIQTKTLEFLMNSKLNPAEVLLDLYRSLESTGDERSREMMRLMEDTIGWKYMQNNELVPREAMAMQLLEIMTGQEIIDDKKNPATIEETYFNAKKGCISSLRVIDFGKFSIHFLELLPHLKFLHISVEYLEEINDLKNLTKLRYFDFSGSESCEVVRINNFKNLQVLHIHFAPISKLEGIEDLKYLIDFYLGDTNIPDFEEQKYKEHVENNKKRLRNEKEELIQLGNNYITQGKVDKAIEVYEHAKHTASKLKYKRREFDYLNHEEWYILAKLYFGKNEYEKALYACEQGIKVNSRPEPIRKLRKQILNILKN